MHVYRVTLKIKILLKILPTNKKIGEYVYWNGDQLDSTEIINLAEDSLTWTEGMPEKSKIVY